MRHLIFIFILVVLAGCATIYSGFDDVSLVWKYDIKISDTEVPDGFMVTPVEVRELVGPMKMSWRIYSDEKNYYLSQIRSFWPGFGNNSHYAKKYGYKLCGLQRDKFEQLRKEIGPGKTRQVHQLNGILNDAGC